MLWSDHGYQLGEKLAFHKFTPWERSLRVPVMVAGPDIKPSIIDEPISLIDLAPTLMTLAGQPIPDQFSGQDLAPLLNDEPCETRGYATAVWLNTDKETKTTAWFCPRATRPTATFFIGTAQRSYTTIQPTLTSTTTC
jgi:arylsulfatase A-like enzyme